MRTISLTAVTLLGAALLTPTGAATAAAEACQGQAATIVGTPGGEIVGTEGADVIVTNGAARVDARGGDDLVCGTGATPVFATILGAGADTFIADSSGGRHYIYAGAVVGREDVVASDTPTSRPTSSAPPAPSSSPARQASRTPTSSTSTSARSSGAGSDRTGHGVRRTDGILGDRSATGDAVMYATAP